MKKNYIILGLLLLNLVLIGYLVICRTPEKGGSLSGQTFYGYTTDFARQVDLPDAMKDIKHWKDFQEEHKINIRAYKISSLNMLQVMGLDTALISSCKYTSCRAYIGLNDDKEFKLYMTPISEEKDAKGKSEQDVFFFKDGSRDATPKPDVKSKQNYVLNLIAPCPKTCDYKSPLYLLSDTLLQ